MAMASGSLVGSHMRPTSNSRNASSSSRSKIVSGTPIKNPEWRQTFIKLSRSSSLNSAPRLSRCFSNLAEKAAVEKPICAALIGTPNSSVSHSLDFFSRYLTCAWTSRTRIDNFQPSPLRSIPPGMNNSIMWRLFCFKRRTPYSRNRPVVKKDLLMFVEKPSIKVPPTNAPRTSREFL